MPSSHKTPPASFVPQQLIIRFKNHVDPERQKEILEKGHARVISRFNDSQLYLVELYGESGVEEAAVYFGQLEDIDFAEPNHILSKDDRKK